ncbi:MMPL family transporter [Gryllotalpicola reticulitermitis]|uniref:MMPL family transporter n=1 Tax=Gryllotalpicola reticulitermitis TaxID=1184153 RepID=A0ABV8Q4I6_9MICO
MAGLLYRLGRFSARRAWLVICAWAVVLGLAVVAFSFGSGHLSDAISIPNTPTTQVQHRLEKVLGKGASGSNASGTIVVQRTSDGALTAGQQTQLADLATAVGKVSGVKSVTNPFTALDEVTTQQQKITAGQAQLAQAKQQLTAGQNQLNAAIAQAKAAGAYDAAQAQFAAQQAKITASQKQLTAQSAQLTQGQQLLTMSKGALQVSSDGRTAIVTVNVDAPQQQIPASVAQNIRTAASKAAPTGTTVDFSQELATQAMGGSTEAIGIVIAAVVLAIMLGTLIAAGLPLLNAIVGVGISYLIVMSFSKLIDMNSTTPILALMLGLAVGIDYTLFILNRHREQLRRGMDVHESIGLANGTSGSAVLFAGITVIVALVALNVTGISFLGLMGGAAALAVAIAVLVAITLTPAILGLSGLRVLPKRVRRRIGTEDVKPAKPLKPMSTPRAWITAVASVVVLGAIALPATQMRLGLPDGGSQPQNSTQYRAYEKVTKAFGAGFNAPLIVVADVPSGLSSSEMTTRELQIGQHLEATKDVAAVVPVTASTEHSVVVFQLIPKGGQNDVSTETLVQHLRSTGASGVRGDFQVAGATSGNIDITDYLARALPPYLAVVIGLSILIMIGVFRSLLVPLLATGGFVLSLFAALGGVTAIFQFGWLGFLFGVHDPGPVLSFLPTLVVGILFGLAMDYMLFIGTGIREAYVHGAAPRVAVVSGLRAGRAVVTAAALIMTAVFSGFIFANNSIISALGFGLAFGVLADAFVVRMLLIPALLHIFGRAAWWLPKWLDRIVLDVDVEGAKLERSHPLPGRAAEDEPVLV